MAHTLGKYLCGVFALVLIGCGGDTRGEGSDKGDDNRDIVPPPEYENTQPRVQNVSVVAQSEQGLDQVRVGELLTGQYLYVDPEGDVEAASQFRWLRDNTVISTAMERHYVVTADDSGHRLTFEVTPVALTGKTQGEPVKSDAIVVNNSAPIATNLRINRSPALGNRLTLSYRYTDADGDEEGLSQVRWLHGDNPIPVSNDIEYRLRPDNENVLLRVELTPIAQSGVEAGEVATVNFGTGIYAAPRVQGFTQYIDTNNDALLNEGDQLRVRFDKVMHVNFNAPESFSLLGEGDTLGENATVEVGPAITEVTITLGRSPSFTPLLSKIDISPAIPAGAIENNWQISAMPSVATDIKPGLLLDEHHYPDVKAQLIESGDIDHDGDQDLVITTSADLNEHVIYLNDGLGNFSPAPEQLAITPTGQVALEDLDRDDDLDIIVANGEEGSRIYFNNRQGQFTDSGQTIGSNATIIALADLDGDQDLDLAQAEWGGPTHIFLNSGAGSFEKTEISLGASTSALALMDVNGDPFPDIVLGSWENGTQIYLNRGALDFDSLSPLPEQRPTIDIIPGDIDGDNDLDFIEVVSVGGGVVPHFNDGAGTFFVSSQELGTESSSAALADMDGDGDLDIVQTRYSTEAKLFLNNGEGLFIEDPNIFGPHATSAVAITDIDGDSDQDVVLGDRLLNPLQVYRNSLLLNGDDQ